jgi:hypothetical protein
VSDHAKDALKNAAIAVAAIICLAWIVMGVLSLMPPKEHSEHSHGHEVGPHDEMVKIPPRKGSQVAQAVEPVGDAAVWVKGLAGVKIAEAHYPFPKFCGHYPAARANHNYYNKNYYWSGDYHYHSGELDHLFGADYRYTFRCGSRDHHYVDWPNGWF